MFRHPGWLLAAIPALSAAWGLFAWADARRRAVAKALGKEETLLRSSEPALSRRAARVRLRLAALALILLALAGPQFGVELVETRSDARSVVVAVDVSLSMRTPDVKPSRLERAKGALSLLIEQLRGERIGVVAFAGEAQAVCPMTQDAEAAKQLLGALEVGAVPVPGTAVGSALRTAAAMLGRYPGGKAVVLLTDGEDHRSDPLGAAREAAAAGVRVFAVGIGTAEGEPIPAETGAYHKDAKGSTVVSRLDEATLAQIARETGGAYYRASPGGDEIADIVRRVKELDAAKGVSGTASLWRNRYAWPAAAAFLLLLAELALAIRPAWPAFALLALAVPARPATAEAELRAGNRLYEKGRYEQAVERFGRAAAKRPKDPRPAFNAGDALYRMDRAEDAAAAFESAAGRAETSAPARAAALYNLGNARYKAGDFPGAAAAYRSALALAPSDADARHNLAVALDRMRNPPPRRDRQDKKKDDPSKPKDDKDQPKGGGGGQGGPDKHPPRPRPQDALTKDEAERVLRAVADREKQAQRHARQAKESRASPRAPTGEDW